MNETHEANRRDWDAAAAAWAASADRQGLWRRCHREPGLALGERERAWLGDVAGARVAVLGSGDNLAAFALAGLGARVTSVDISAEQLAVARRRADELGLRLEFVRADVTELPALPGEPFDLVYTGGHIAVWVSDLRRFYAEAARILKPGGRLVISEYHPFRRIWQDRGDRLEPGCSYFARGPYDYAAGAGGHPTHEFHWTVGDFVGAVIAAGCEVLAVEEYGEGSDGGWEAPPVGPLPRVLLVAGRRRVA